MTYSTNQINIDEYAKAIANGCGIVGNVQLSGEFGRQVINGTQKVVVSSTGEWRFSDTAVMSAPVTDNDAIESAIKFVTGELLGNFTIAQSSVEDVVRNGESAGKLVYLEMGIGGKRICGSCEIAVTVGEDSGIAEAVKNNAYFSEYKEVKIISSSEALEKAKAGEGGHTLFASARSAVIDTAETAYWLEETKGTLQPIWLFSGTAKLDDGSDQEFEVYIPAMKS